MTTQKAAVVSRTSWRYRILGWFYKSEGQFPKTACGVRANVIVQPIGYITSCLLLLCLTVTLFLSAGAMLRVPVGRGSTVLIGLGIFNLLFLVITFVWPRLWWFYFILDITITSPVLVFVMKGTFSLLPGRVELIALGVLLGLIPAALMTAKWWMPWLQRYYARICKPVEYL